MHANCKSSQHTNTQSNWKHAECYFTQNLKKISLSPNEKAQVLVKHATEQQTYQQSLSQEDKAQMLPNEADTERKLCKSLPPEKKVKKLETDAAAHKKMRVSFS